jgi:NitT/TauT family transport system substrate-binding protein
MLHRVKSFAIAAGVVFALLGQTTSSAQTLTKIRVNTIPIIDTVPLAAALAKGYFKEQGLDVDTTPSAGGATGLPALAAGHIQIGYSGITSVVQGAQQGLGFQMIAAGSASGDAPPNTGGLFTKKGANIKSGKDLEGKRVGINTRSSISYLVTRAWTQITGGNPDRITFVEVPFPNMVDAVRGNQIDVGLTVEPFLSAGVASGATEIIGWPYDRVMKRLPLSQFVSTKSYIDANPGVIERFVRGYNKGIDWVNQNRGSDEWVNLIASHTKLAPEQIRNIALPLWVKTVNQADVEKIVDLMRKQGMLEDRPMDVKSLLYTTATTAVQ